MADHPELRSQSDILLEEVARLRSRNDEILQESHALREQLLSEIGSANAVARNERMRADALEEQIRQARDENARLREALTWCAEAGHWRLAFEGGARCRAALGMPDIPTA